MSGEEIEKMTMTERLETMELLWDSLLQNQEDISSPEWHRQVLQERRERIDSGEATYYTLDQLTARLKNR